jgi:MFS family permease
MNARGASRFLLLVYVVPGAFGGLYGGYLLAHEVRHWAAWLFAFLVLEPIGITCLLAIPAILAPDSAAAQFLDWSVPRARRAAILFLGLFLLLVLALCGYVMVEWMRG